VAIANLFAEWVGGHLVYKRKADRTVAAGIPNITEGTTCAGDVLAIPVTHRYVAKTTAGDAEALTLADSVPGHLLTISLVTDGGGDGTLTPTTKTGFSTIVFADAKDTATLLYVDDTIGWILVGYYGTAAPPVVS
jgi:tartrate dehydratase alpha subunit/fumarate hydratase class I-like protein